MLKGGSSWLGLINADDGPSSCALSVAPTHFCQSSVSLASGIGSIAGADPSATALGSELMSNVFMKSFHFISSSLPTDDDGANEISNWSGGCSAKGSNGSVNTPVESSPRRPSPRLLKNSSLKEFGIAKS